MPELKAIYKGNDLKAQVLREAEKLEGSVRNTGVHAAGIIIAPYDLTDIVPVATAKDSDLLVTQFDGRVIEDAGVIKMDFLGLKTLTIIKDALRLIKQNHGVKSISITFRWMIKKPLSFTSAAIPTVRSSLKVTACKCTCAS